MLVGYASSSSESEEEEEQNLEEKKSEAKKEGKTSEQSKEGKVKEKSKGKKRKKKKRKKQKGLPLLEQPPNVESDDEESSSLEGDAPLSSVWDDVELASSSSQIPSSTSLAPQGPEKPSSAPTVTLEADTFTAAVAAAEEEEEEEEEAAVMMDRKIEKLLMEGKAVEGLQLTRVSAEDISADARERALARQRAIEERQALTGRISTEETIDGRQISATMKRKHQLTSLAFEAQQLETNFDNRVASTIAKRPRF